MDRSAARSLIYSTLSLCYIYPDEKVYASIAADEWILGIRQASHLLDENIFDDHLGAIEQSISGRGEDEQMVMTREYKRLFSDASPHIIAPPYGSFYLEKDGLFSAKAAPEVLHFYHEAGFALKENPRTTPDHIVHELEFMGMLASKEGQAMGNEKIRLEEIQMNFLSRFILPWVPAFCNTVVDHSHYPFYHHLSNLTKEFINFEKNYLGVPEELNFSEENESGTIRV